MKNIVKTVFLVTAMSAGAVQAAALSDSDYPFVPNASSIDAGQKAEQRITKESSSPKVIVNSTKTHEAVMQELVEYNRAHGDAFISH